MPVNDFKRVEGISKLNESFIKSYNEESDEGYFLEVNIQYTENLHKTQNNLPLLPERIKILKVETRVANSIKLNMLFTQI